jgi:hypothetical protein
MNINKKNSNKMLNGDTILIFLSFILIIMLINHYNKCCYDYNTNEGFRLFYESSPSTRNMSYDLRCEPVIPKTNFGIRDSSIEPLYRRKCLDIVSRN